jgi:hypothetical protein
VTDGQRASERNDAANFAVKMADACATHAEWLALVRFGLGTLLEDQALLIEIVVREADRAAKTSPIGRVAGDVAPMIFAELGLAVVRGEGGAGG